MAEYTNIDFDNTENEISLGDIFNFNTPNHIFQITLKPGYYRCICAGGRGTLTAGSNWGYGAITKGTLILRKTTTLYICIGQNQGYRAPNWSYPIGTYPTPLNGSFGAWGGYSGGAATDIRLKKVSGNWWSDMASICSRIMVAGGGGATCWAESNPSNCAGGIQGYTGTHKVERAGQTSTFAVSFTEGPYFGVAGCNGAAGGGGWYGGHADGHVENRGGHGGSSFISGHPGCLSVDKEYTSVGIVNHKNNSIHYSGLKFIDTEMLPELPPNSPKHELQNNGDNYASIQYIQKVPHFFMKDSDGKIKYWDTVQNAWQVLQMKVKEILNKLKEHFHNTSSEYFNSGGVQYGNNPQ